MRKLLIILTVAILLGAVAYQFNSPDKGYLVLSIGTYVVETTLWGAVIAFALVLVAVYVAFKCVSLLWLPRDWWRARAGKKKVKFRDKTAQGVIDFLEDNWPRAIDNFTTGLNHSETPGINYLGAAVANFNLGDEVRCQELLANAEEKGVLDTVALGLIRTRLLLQKGQYENALTLAEQLHRKSPSHPTVLRLLVAVRKGVRDWHGVERLLPDLKKYKALSEDERATLELDVYGELIDAFSSTKSANKALKEQQAELDHLWDRVPNKLKKNSVLVAAFVRQLQLLGLPEKAENRLRRFLNKHWDDQLARLYGEIEADEIGQLRVAESWLKKYPDNPHLLAALGRLCVRCELWGKGREYFQMALKLDPQPETWLELGELLQQLKDMDGSIECYRRGLKSLIKA